MSNFPSGNFPKVRLGLLRRRRLHWGPSAAARMGQRGRALRLEQTWKVFAWEIAHLGSVDIWENTLGLPLGKIPLEKYLTSLKLRLQSLQEGFLQNITTGSSAAKFLSHRSSLIKLSHCCSTQLLPIQRCQIQAAAGSTLKCHNALVLIYYNFSQTSIFQNYKAFILAFDSKNYSWEKSHWFFSSVFCQIFQAFSTFTLLCSTNSKSIEYIKHSFLAIF